MLSSHSPIHVDIPVPVPVHVRKQQEQLSATAGCEWTAAKSSRQKMSNTNRTERKLRRKRAKGNETEHNRIKAETQKQSKPTNEARQGRRRDADDDVLTVTNCSRGSCLGDLLLPRLLGLCSWPENKKKKSRVGREKKKNELSQPAKVAVWPSLLRQRHDNCAVDWDGDVGGVVDACVSVSAGRHLLLPHPSSFSLSCLDLYL